MPDAHFIQIDEEGYFHTNGQRLEDQTYCRTLFENLQFNDHNSLVTSYDGHESIIEAFDQPLIVKNLEVTSENLLLLTLPYGHTELVDPLSPHQHLRLDEWDRFHGKTSHGIPFVFSRAAQASFFDLLDDFDDSSITWKGQKLDVPDWLTPHPESEHAEFWNNIYQNETPRWELNEPAKALVDTLPQLKLGKCRILVLGAGSSEDAAYLAKQGHLVTAVDFSHEAIKAAKSKFSGLSNIQWVQEDAFKFLAQAKGQFDLVFEHTFFCTVNPSSRTRLLQLWKEALVERGHLLGIFFVHSNTEGPPYGGSEWELRKRFNSLNFRLLYWTRWQLSLEKRLGKELVVFAEKKQ